MARKVKTTHFEDTTGEIYGEDVRQDPGAQNRDFVMIYRRFIRNLANLSAENPTACTIFLFLAKFVDGKNAVMITMGLMSELVGFSRQTCSAQVKYLEQHGWLQIIKMGRSNLYVLNPDVVWTSYSRDKRYCKFDSAVYLTPDAAWDTGVRRQDKFNVRHITRDMADTAAQEMGVDLPEPPTPNPIEADDTQIPGQMSIADFVSDTSEPAS